MKTVKKMLKLVYPMINELDHFWTIPKWQTPKIDVCGVALGKRDLMQKSEWKKSENWLLGNENGEKNAQVGLYPIINELDHFWTIPKWQTPQIDACGVALTFRLD